MYDQVGNSNQTQVPQVFKIYKAVSHHQSKCHEAYGSGNFIVSHNKKTGNDDEQEVEFYRMIDYIGQIA